MKNILIVLVCCLGFTVCASHTVAAQETAQLTKEEQKAAKAKKKAVEKRLREIHDSIDREFAIDALNEHQFVVMAKRLSIRNFTYSNPRPNMNFILVQGDEATIQIAFENGQMGLNGLGGITVEGHVSGWKTKTDKKGNITVDFSVMGAAVSAQVSISLPTYSNEVSAMVNPNFGPGDLRISGPLVPYEGGNTQKAYKGSITR